MHTHVREPFSASYQIRRDQHTQLDDFLEKEISDSRSQTHGNFSPSYRSIKSYSRSLRRYRGAFADLIGYPGKEYPELTAYRPRIAELVLVGEDDVCEVHRVWIGVGGGLQTYGLLMLPKKRAEKVPLIVACHGGGGCPEAICDLDTREPYRSFGPLAVDLGYAVWAPLILMNVTYGGDPTAEKDRYYFDRTASLVGLRVVGIEVFKILRGLSGLLEARPELDWRNVGMAGLSYGGYFALCCAAMSTVLKASVCSGFFHDYADSGSFVRRDPVSGSDGRFFNVLREFDLAATAGLVCPRPLLIQHGSADTVISVRGTREAVADAVKYYRRLGVEDCFEYHEHDGGHEFENSRIFVFFAKNLGGRVT